MKTLLPFSLALWSSPSTALLPQVGQTEDVPPGVPSPLLLLGSPGKLLQWKVLPFTHEPPFP